MRRLEAVERTSGFAVRYHESVVRHLEHPGMLNALEHSVNGSTPQDVQMNERLLVPQGLRDGSMTPEQVRDLRRVKRWFASTVASAHFFPHNQTGRLILLTLPDIDRTRNETDGLPELYGVFKSDKGSSGEIITDPARLKSMGLRPEAVRSHLVQRLVALQKGQSSQH